MNSNTKFLASRKTLIAAAVAAVLLAACATAPSKPDGAERAREKLAVLQADPNLASRAPVAIKEADVAVGLAEQPEADAALAAHRVYLADRKVDTARAVAETRLAEDQRTDLTAQREKVRLEARTREADSAHLQVANAQSEAVNAQARALNAQAQVATAQAAGEQQRLAADSARSEADAARLAAANSDLQAAELQRQVDALHAKATDRGLVLTLGDTLFATGRADLKAPASGNLDKLVAFLNKYPERTASIEGFTDSVGSEDYNQSLSERRADSVKSYLVRQGVDSHRLTSAGRGKQDPIADNDSALGRQANRRVEVVINNPASASR